MRDLVKIFQQNLLLPGDDAACTYDPQVTCLL